MGQDIFVKTFKQNKRILKMINLQAMNDEIAMTSFLEILKTGPVFNSLLLAKYIPDDLNSDDKIIYSWKNLGEGTRDWLEFAESIKSECEKTLYALSGASVATILGICALNAYGVVVLAGAVVGTGLLGLSLVKEAQTQKLLKVVLLTIGWHAPTVLYITYQILVLTTILAKLRAMKKTSDEKMKTYESANIQNESSLKSLCFYINHKKDEIRILEQTLSYKSTVALLGNHEMPWYANENFQTLEDMRSELKRNVEDYENLLNEIERYKIGAHAYDTQDRFLLTTYSKLKRIIAELTLCQKCIGTLSVVSIMNDIMYTLFYTVEKMDGEWNFLSHQFGMWYSYTASQKMDPSGAKYLLSPFGSVFHAIARCTHHARTWCWPVHPPFQACLAAS